METLTSDASGDISQDFPIKPNSGAIVKVKIEIPAATTGPSAGTIGIYHQDDANSLTLIDRDSAGTASELTATGSALGAEFTVVAHTGKIRLVGASLTASKDLYAAVTPTR